MRRSVALVAVCAVLAAGCSDRHPPPPESITGHARIERFRAGGHRALLLRPAGDELRGLVVYHHGMGEDANSVYAEVIADLVARILREGWAVAASDAAGDNWGNRPGIAAYAALWAEVRPRLEPERVVHLSHSMGGLTALSCIALGCGVPADGWIGIYPVTDQRSMARSRDAEEFLLAIERAFGSHVPAELIPVEAAGALTRIPMVMWASPDDETVPMESNAATLAELVDAAGGQVELHVAEGGHGDPSHFDPDTVARFLRDVP